MFCKLCGQQVSEDKQYCPNCGAKIEVPPVAPQASQPQVNGTFVSAPNVAPDYAPNPAQGYNPNPAQGYNPNPAQGYNPNPAQGYNPNPAQGYNPNPAQGYNPNPAQGYNPNPAYGYVPNPGPATVKLRGTTGFSALGSNAAVFFISVGLLLLNIILMYCPCISVSASRYYSIDYTFSLYTGDLGYFDSDAGYMVFFGIIILMGYLGGMVLSMLPVMANKKWGSKFFICGRIACIVGLSFFLLFFVILAADASYYVDVTLTFGGWMYLLCSIGGFVMSIVAPNVICKGVAKAQTPPPAYMPPAY